MSVCVFSCCLQTLYMMLFFFGRVCVAVSITAQPLSVLPILSFHINLLYSSRFQNWLGFSPSPPPSLFSAAHFWLHQYSLFTHFRGDLTLKVSLSHLLYIQDPHTCVLIRAVGGRALSAGSVDSDSQGWKRRNAFHSALLRSDCTAFAQTF